MLCFPVGSPSARPVSSSPSAVVTTRVEVRWSIRQAFTQGMKAGLLLVVVDHEDGVVVVVAGLPGIRLTPVLLNQDQIANLQFVVEDTEGVDGVTDGIVVPPGHRRLKSEFSPSLHVPDAHDPPIEMPVIWLYSQGPGGIVATGWALLHLGPAVGGGVVTIERFW